MAIYKLWRQRDNEEFVGEEARDAVHAAAIFSQKVGVELTLKEGDAAPDYMMRLVEKRDPMNPSWAPPPNISVWIKEPSPSN